MNKVASTLLTVGIGVVAGILIAEALSPSNGLENLSIDRLYKKMSDAAAVEDYEQCAIIRDVIKKKNHLVS